MKIVMFYHSLISDWNHGNAHFLRGVVSELISRGHRVDVYEPHNAWSVQNLIRENGEKSLRDYQTAYPSLKSHRYQLEHLELPAILKDADLVIVHEWNEHELVRLVGEHRKHNNYTLFFHDTHHRSVTAWETMDAYDLRHYDGVLAFGNIIRNIYLKNNWARQAWVWHEASDTRVFKPRPNTGYDGEIVWIGNWGDDERTAELHEFLLGPIKDLKLKARVYGVRYPAHALEALDDAGIEYGGWLPNYRVPEIFSRFKLTIHVPRRPYARALPGIPTIRPFEALACGIPLVSAPWSDVEGLFSDRECFLFANSGREMTQQLERLLADAEKSRELAANGQQTIHTRHTCAHRVDQLLQICEQLKHDRIQTERTSEVVQ